MSSAQCSALMLLALALLRSGASAAPRKLEIGYPVRVTLRDEASLCPLQVDVPERTGRMEIMVDVVEHPTLSLGQKTVDIYAARGTSVARTAELRRNTKELSDVRTSIIRPQAGVWTIALYARCHDLICNPLNNLYDVRISVLFFDYKDRVHIPLLPNRASGRFELRLEHWAYFQFKLDVPTPIYFDISYVAGSRVTAGMTIVSRRTTSADLLGSAAGLPTLADANHPSAIGGVMFDAGFHIIGISPSSLKLGSSAEFFVNFAKGAEPTDNEATLPSNYCPNGRAPDETGVYSRCRELNCATCISSVGSSEGCVWCEGNGYKQCWKGNKCPPTFGFNAAPQRNAMVCSKCSAPQCSDCQKIDGCAWCTNTFFGSTTRECMTVADCQSPPLPGADQCVGSRVGEDDFDTSLTFPPTPQPPGNSSSNATIVMEMGAADRTQLATLLVAIVGILSVLVQLQ